MAKSRRPRGENPPKTKAELEQAFKREQAARTRAVAAMAAAESKAKRAEAERDALRSNRSETLGRQTATDEILRLISSSRTDAQPVFDAIARYAAALTGGVFCNVFRFDGKMMYPVAFHNFSSDAVAFIRSRYPTPPTRDSAGGRAVLDRAVVHFADVEQHPDLPASRRLHDILGFRSILSVPLLLSDQPIGSLTIGGREPKPFSDDHVGMLQTFADQAVIAIENVRLFTEVQEKNRAVSEALDQQTATADVLRIIAQSPAELQPVLDAIAKAAVRLCEASDAVIERLDGDRFYNAAHAGTQMSGLVGLPLPLSRRFPGGRAVLDRKPIIIDDLHLVAEREYPDTLELLRLNTIHSVAEIPLLSEGKPLGTIAVLRAEIRPFTSAEVALLQTFADQAVIAIENARLFTELQARNRDLTEALDRQTASAEILRAISQSQTDVQPVFDAIVNNAVRLCGATQGGVYRFDGATVHSVAHAGHSPEQLAEWRALFPRALVDIGPLLRKAIEGKQIVLVDDTETVVPDAFRNAPLSNQPSAAIALKNMRARGVRSSLFVPMLWHDEVIGVISMVHDRVSAFSSEHVELLKTFADQAVIAIENARLLSELQARTTDLTRSVDQLTALGEVSRAVSSTLDLDRVLNTVVLRASQLAGADGCSIFEYDAAAGGFRMRATSQIEPTALDARRAALVPAGEGAVGRLSETRAPVQIADISSTEAYRSPLRDTLIAGGFRALLAVPMIQEDGVVGGLVVSRKAPGEFPAETVELLQTFANQSALAIANARLFREIEEKSAQLEVANQHKSEFLANMSHELRTPLNAVIGFSDVLLEGMFGEVNEKQTEYLRDILSSGTHLLSLINDILDLSKIEAGRMELDLTDFDVPQAIDNALTLMRERASRHGIALSHVIGEGMGEIRGDERKFKQVLLNLLSNAVKFTPSGGKVEIRARRVDGIVEVAVADTGEGIAPEDQQAVFEEFRQVGKSSKKIEGTGLGLALCRKFVELQGGTIGVESQVGVGSTFTFTVPLDVR